MHCREIIENGASSLLVGLRWISFESVDGARFGEAEGQPILRDKLQ